MHRSAFLLATLALISIGANAEELRNWFDDPFFVISAALPDCPEPAGPRVTEAQRLAQSHWRAEKGTTCWLAEDAECQRANAFSYDQDIASQIRAAVNTEKPFPNTSLWVTVQGRVVYVQGCVQQEAQAVEIEAFIRRLPHVQQVFATVTANPKGKPPYKPFTAR